MSNTRIVDLHKDQKRIGSRKHISDTRGIQQHLEEKSSDSNVVQIQAQIPKFIVEVDEDMFEGHMNLIKSKHEDIQKLEQDLKDVNEMFKDLAQVINEQQPCIDTLQQTLESVHAHTEQADKELIEAEKRGGWCAIM